MNMKKILVLIAAISACTAAVTNDNAKAQHNGVVHVQGKHPHKGLTQKAKEGRWKQTKLATKQLGDVPTPQCWAGTGQLDRAYPIDTAYLIVKWTDGKRPDADPADSMLVWGYVWNPYTIYGTDTTWYPKYTVDMIKAVANADCQFTALLQWTGQRGGYTVGGFGYNQSDLEAGQRVPIAYDFAAAQGDASIDFHYTTGTMPDCVTGQIALPPRPGDQVNLAVQAGYVTGIIEHPLSGIYGYPAYDYDYFALNPDEEDYRWQAGWYNNGYWAFFVGENKQVPVNYPQATGISTRQLLNGSTDGFVFAINFDYSKNMSGTITSADCSECPSCPHSNKRK
jgi:hypothetical protein